MAFNSFSFLLFIAVAYPVFYKFPNKDKWQALLSISYAFCAFFSFRACLVLFLISLLDFIGGTLIYNNRNNEGLQKTILYSLVALNVLVLTYLKYWNFLLENFNIFLAGLKLGQLNLINILAPVGISYYLIQGTAYLVDIYWEKIECETSLGHFLLFMSFFPKLTMGPIERGDDLLPQLKKLDTFKFDYYNTKSGFLLFLWGFFQKVVIADVLAIQVNQVYDRPMGQTGMATIIAVIIFSFQLYYDFAGYTNMAMGIGRLFNIKLSPNFNHPYFADNIQDFWRKWHMSFSFWIRDYLFTPFMMKYRSRKKVGMVLALLSTFIVVGLWHEAMWTYVIFGVFHGIYLSISNLTLNSRDNFWKKRGLLKKKWLIYGRRASTFLIVSFSMIFFRANNISDAFEVIKNFFRINSSYFDVFSVFTTNELEYACLIILFAETVHLIQRSGKLKYLLFETPGWARWSIYYAMVVAIFFLGDFTSKQNFLYFQF